jgi:hypothetical protein
MIAAAESLVPPRSEVLDVIDNSRDLTLWEGDYWAALQINDGGLGAELLTAVKDRAGAGGWLERYRCDLRGAVRLGFVRDDLKVDVSVTTAEPLSARIWVQRLGDGDAWPQAC